MASAPIARLEPAPPAVGDAARAEAVRPARKFLFLQGMPGPFFRRLGRALRAQGFAVRRVNFNGGDVFDWPGAPAYRGRPEDWPAWLERHVDTLGITDIVVFGDCRELHRPARILADRRGLRFHAFEEGYLRPDHVTLERGGVNGQSSLPRSLPALRLLDERLAPAEPFLGIPGHFRHRLVQAVRYYAALILARPFFPHYRSHRRVPLSREARGWVRRRLRRRAEVAASRNAIAAIAGRPFFLVPLQLDGDSQLLFCSPFASMREPLEQIIASFARAPNDAVLLVKMHPFDPDVNGWRAIVAEIAAQAGLSDRVFFIERFDLHPLLRDTSGVVTVNSTVGPLALAEGKPVMALGGAIYRVPGITASGALDDFWRAPPPVEAENLALLRRVLFAKCLVNGGFHSEQGLARLVHCSVGRMLRP